MHLIIGLGNPGKEYQGTRHNVGREVVVGVADGLNAEAFKLEKKFDALVAEIVVDNEKVLLVLPETFMNLSGDAVTKIVAFYHVPLENILVVHDEMDFAPGVFAYSKSGGSAGHNGVSSVMESLGTEAFARLRIGIGRPTSPMKSEAYVLQKMGVDEKTAVDNALKLAKTSVMEWVTSGIDKTMNKWNVIKGGNKHVDN